MTRLPELYAQLLGKDKKSIVAKRRSKYKAIRTEVNGKTCDSKLEAKHYNELIILEKFGEIHSLVFHPKWDATVNGEKIGVIELDFSFYDNKEKKYRYIDTKGVDTAMSRWKRKHLKAEHGIKVELWRK